LGTSPGGNFLYRLESTTVVCFEGVTANPVCVCVPTRSAEEGAKGQSETKEAQHARRAGSGCSLLSGCDSEVWVAIKKQPTVAFFQGHVNSQKYECEGRVESRLGDVRQRCAKKYYVQAANVADSDSEAALPGEDVPHPDKHGRSASIEGIGAGPGLANSARRASRASPLQSGVPSAPLGTQKARKSAHSIKSAAESGGSGGDHQSM